VARYVVDPVRSTVSAITRPALGGGPGPAVASVTGRVDVVGNEPAGSITVTLEGPPAATARIDLEDTTPEVTPGADGTLVLQGGTSRPAGAFGLIGPPLLNPTVLLRWRLVLAPA
jgi:hypothetical protein